MQKSKLPSIVTILITTLITVIAWVGFSVYRAFTSSSSPSVPENVSRALDPSLDTSTINQVESRIFFSGSQIPEVNTASPTPSIPAIPTSTPISTPQATISGTPVATQSAVPSGTP